MAIGLLGPLESAPSLVLGELGDLSGHVMSRAQRMGEHSAQDLPQRTSHATHSHALVLNLCVLQVLQLITVYFLS